MFYIKKFLKCLILGFSLVNLNQIYSMQNPEIEFLDVQNKPVGEFKIVIYNETGYDLSIESIYSSAKKREVYSNPHELKYVLKPNATLFLKSFNLYHGNKFEVEKIRISYKEAILPLSISLDYAQILQASNGGVKDIAVIIKKTALSRLYFEFGQYHQESFIDMASIDIKNNYGEPIVILKKILNQNENIETRDMEVIFIKNDEDLNIPLSSENSKTTSIFVARGHYLNYYFDKYPDIRSLFKARPDVFSDLKFVKFLDNNLVKKLKSKTKPGFSPILVISKPSENLLRIFSPDQPVVNLFYKNLTTGDLSQSKYDVHQEQISDFNTIFNY